MKQIFKTLRELKEAAENQYKQKRDRTSILDKIKNVLGSNEKANKEFEKAEEFFSAAQKTKKTTLEKIAKLTESLTLIYLAKFLASFKDKRFDRLEKQCEKLYLSECENFVKDEFANPLKIRTDEVFDAVQVLDSEKYGDFIEYKSRIETISLIQDFISEMTNAFSKIRFVENIDDLNLLKNKYIHIAKFEDEFKYGIFFNKIRDSFVNMYKKTTEYIKEKVNLEKMKPLPNAEKLMSLYEKSQNLEIFFSDFIKIKDKGYYKTELEELKKQLESLAEIKLKMSNRLDRVSKDKNHTDSLNDAYLSIKEIDYMFDSIKYEYEEINEYKKELKLIQNEYRQLIDEISSLMIKEIENKISSEDINYKNFINQNWEIIDETASLHSNLKEIPYVTEKLDRIRSKAVNSIEKKIISENVPEKQNSSVEEHITFLKDALINFRKLENFEKIEEYKEQYERLKNLYKFFKISSEKQVEHLNHLQESISDNHHKEIIKWSFIIEGFIKKYKNSELFNYLDVKQKINELESQYAGIQSDIKEYISYNRLKDGLILYNTKSNKRYIFLTKEEIVLGRSKNADIIIPSKIVSKAHTVIDSSKNDLENKGKNGTFINNMGNESVLRVNINNVHEFNIAQGFTFLLNKYEKLLIIKLTSVTADDLFLIDTSRNEFLDKMLNMYFIKIEAGTSLFIDKISGEPSVSYTDKSDVWEIKKEMEGFSFSDWLENVLSYPILKKDNQLLSPFIIERNKNG